MLLKNIGTNKTGYGGEYQNCNGDFEEFILIGNVNTNMIAKAYILIFTWFSISNTAYIKVYKGFGKEECECNSGNDKEIDLHLNLL